MTTRSQEADGTFRTTMTSGTISTGCSLMSHWLIPAPTTRAGDDSLEVAQERKFKLICEKLDLRPLDHLLEIGTGWGGFAAYAATHYGCRITTTTISREQHDYARAGSPPWARAEIHPIAVRGLPEAAG